MLQLPKPNNVILFLIPHANGAWKDLKTGNVYTQSTTAAQPQLRTGVNGLPCLYHDGGDYVEIPHDAKFNLTTYTWAFMINPTALNNKAIITKGTDVTVQNNYRAWVSSTGYMRVGSGDAEGALLVTAANSFYTNQSKYAAFSFNNTSKVMMAYAGAVSTTASFPAYTPVTNSENIYIGCHRVAGVVGGQWNGNIQAVILYNTTLTPTEHAELNKFLRANLYLPSTNGCVFWGGAKSVSAILDKTGGASAVQPTPANQPTLITGGGWNARKVLRFNGTSQRMYIPHNDRYTLYTGGHNLSITWVGKINSISNDYQVLFEKDSGSAIGYGLFTRTSGKMHVQAKAKTGDTTAVCIKVGQMQCFTLCIDVAGKHYFYVDGVLYLEDAFVNNAGGGGVVSLCHRATSLHLNCDLQDFIIQQRLYAATEVASLHKHLRTLRD